MWAVQVLCEIALVFPLSDHVHKEQAEGAEHLLQISLTQCFLFHVRLYLVSHHIQKWYTLYERQEKISLCYILDNFC